jgi:hypothetical protein
MAGSFRRRPHLLAVAVVPFAILIWFEPLALLLAMPWIVAAAWAIRRYGLPSDLEALPSAADEARRRLAVR